MVNSPPGFRLTTTHPIRELNQKPISALSSFVLVWNYLRRRSKPYIGAISVGWDSFGLGDFGPRSLDCCLVEVRSIVNKLFCFR